MDKINVYDLPFMKKEGVLEKLVNYIQEDRYSAIGISNSGRICQCEDIDNGMSCAECIFESEPSCEWGLLRWMFGVKPRKLTANEMKLLEILDCHFSAIKKIDNDGNFELLNEGDGAVTMIEARFNIYEDVSFESCQVGKWYHVDELLTLPIKE